MPAWPSRTIHGDGAPRAEFSPGSADFAAVLQTRTVFKQVEHGIELGFDPAKHADILSNLVEEIFVLDASHIDSRAGRSALAESSPFYGLSALMHYSYQINSHAQAPPLLS